MNRLEGKVALVTGATQGLGFAMAKRLAAEGAIVWISGRDQAKLDEAVSRIDGDARAIAFDVTDEGACIAAFARIAAETGLDILVNNAGGRDRRALDQIERADMAQLLDVNVTAPFDLCRKAVPLMRARGYGRIINITSIAAEVARGDASYTASKGALASLTRGLAAELGSEGFTVNAVAPGFFATEANADMIDDPEIAEHLKRRTSLGRWGQPEEIAGAVTFLASEDASYVTGHTLTVDGGYVTHF